MSGAQSNLPFVISHWYHFFESLPYSTQALYEEIERAIKGRNLPEVHVHRIELSEGGIFSAKRLYLRVSRRGMTFDICGASYGNGFFVSWWLSEPLAGCLGILLQIPYLGLIFNALARPDTYFKRDTALMFQESIRQAVQEVLRGCLESRALRALTEEEQKPILRSLGTH